MDKQGSRFFELMRGRGAAAPAPGAVAARPETEAPFIGVADSAVETVLPEQAEPIDAGAIAGNDAAEPVAPVAPIADEPVAAAPIAEEATSRLPDRPRTAAENAGGRDGRTIIDDMLRQSRELGEPVVLRLPVTPEMARYILTLNESNRKLAPVKLLQYKDDVTEGRWEENGEGISISIDGALTNGQHRMHMIDETGVTVVMNVTVGVTRKSRGTNDIGKPKSHSDHLSMEGHANSTALAAAGRMIIAFASGSGESLGNPGPISTARLREVLESDPDIAVAAAYGVTNATKIRRYTTSTVLAFMRYQTRRIDDEASLRFLEGVITGAEHGRGLDTNDPRYRVRETLANMIKKNNTPERVEILFRAWNAWRQGRTFESSIQPRGKLPALR